MSAFPLLNYRLNARGLGVCGVSINTGSTDTFVTDTDATETLKAPTLMSLETPTTQRH